MIKKQKGIILVFTILVFSFAFLNINSIKHYSQICNAQTINDIQNEIKTDYVSGFKVDVLHAYYYDLDHDGYYDDVYTIIAISSISGYVDSLNGEIYQYLTLPSGHTYYLRLTVHGYDDYFRIYTRWYNVATERGWYQFKASIENININGYTYDETTVIFDPPTPAPEGAMPTATVSYN
jgi:hypothetical protein